MAYSEDTASESDRFSSGAVQDYQTLKDPAQDATGIKSSMVYRANILGSWETFAVMFSSKTVWKRKGLWKMVCNLLCISACCAVIPLLTLADPSSLRASRLTAVSQFLNVVVGLLLGFFLTSSINRWYACVDGFLELLDAIRNLQMQFIALGVPKAQESHILRHAFASAFLLYEQLLYDNKKLLNDFSEEKESALMWQKVASKPALMSGDPTQKLLDAATIDILKDTRDPPSVLWTWIAAHIGRLAQDGWIPAMPTPTYGRIMNLCQMAHGGIRSVRASICVQTPWNYAQCLAALVHINNGLNAVILGLVSGVVLATTLQRNKVGGYVGLTSLADIENDCQNLLVTVLLCTTGPVVYQSLLLIGISLAQPFDDKDAKIPMDCLLDQLELDMRDSMTLLGKVAEKMNFKPPSFKPEDP